MRREAASLLSWAALDLVRLSTCVRAASQSDVRFETIDFAEYGTLLQFDFRFGEIGFGLAEVGDALFGVGAILSCLLLDLVAEVIELGLGVAGLVDLLGGVEDGDEVARVYFGPVGDELREGHGAALAEDLGHENLGGVHGFDDAGDADFAFYAGGIGGGGVGDGRCRTGAGSEEEKEGGNRQG